MKIMNQNQTVSMETENEAIKSNLNWLESHRPTEILFSMEEVAIILKVSYEFIRNQINRRIISSINFGKRKMVHRNELARLLAGGISID